MATCGVCEIGSDCFQSLMAESRAAGKREMAKAARKEYLTRTRQKPHSKAYTSKLPFEDWLLVAGGGEKK